MKQMKRRVLIHSHEFSAAHRDAIQTQGFEIVAISQGELPGCNHLSLAELYHGSPRLRGFATEVPAREPLPDSFVRQYSRGIGRLGFLPNGEYYSYAGGNVPLVDLEDYATLHWRYAAGVLKAWAIDEVWFWWAPHLGVDQALWQAAQDLGLTCLILYQLPFVNKFMASGARGGNVRPLPLVSARAWKGGACEPDLFYMRPDAPRSLLTVVSERGRYMLRNSLTRSGRAEILARAYVGASKRAWWPLVGLIEAIDPGLRPLAGLRRRQRREWQAGKAARRFVRPEAVREPFVYFALHYEPELSADVYGGDYANQVDALGRLVARLPKGWRLLVKENPQQQFLKRSWAFFERCRLLDRLDFVPDDTDSARLIERAAVTVSLSGTVVYEAMLREKCAVYFGEPWYAQLPGAIRWTDDLDLEWVSAQRVDRSTLDAAINQWLSSCPDGIVAPRFDVLLPDNAGWQSQAAVTAISLRRLSDAMQSLD